MAVIGYIRVSDAKQNESLQIDALKAAGCEQLFGDHGVSGATIKRKALDAVLAMLQPGDTLVVWKFDRLGRSTIHLLLLFDDFRKRGIHFVSTTQGINTATFEGRIFFGQLALFAEYERELIRERTKAGIEAARRRGKQIGRPRKLKPQHIDEALHLKSEYHYTHRQIALKLGISSRTISRAFSTQTERPSHACQ